MKYTRIFFFAAVFLGFSFVGALGQSSELSTSQIAKKLEAADALFRRIPSRAHLTIEWIGESDPYAVTKFTTEIIPPSRRRMLQENNSPGTFKTREIINFDGRNYIRLDYQAWQVFQDPVPAGPLRSREEAEQARPEPKATETGRFIERVVIDGRSVDVFEIRKVVVFDGNGRTNTATVRFWLRDDGYLIKKINEIKHYTESRTNRATFHYEYNNIFIEEPIVPTGN